MSASGSPTKSAIATSTTSSSSSPTSSHHHLRRSSSTTSVDDASLLTEESHQNAPDDASSGATGRYSVDLFQAFEKVCQKAKSGAQTCNAVAYLIQERANIETAYARALLKIAQNAKAEDWATQLSDCWARVQETLENIALEHSDFASKMHSSMVSGAKAFAAQQESQVQRLITEGTKVRHAQQQMINSLDKAKEKYDRKCAEAAEITAALRREENTTAASATASLPTDGTPTQESSGAGQLFSKMWDSTSSSFGRNALERQRSKLDVCLDEVIAAEKHYLQTVDFMNAQRLICEREIKENLHAFQLTEEQRIEYLKDLLLRSQKAFVKTLQQSQKFVEKLKELMGNIDEFADIEQGFRKLSTENEDVYLHESDLSNNAFYQRMTHIQSMSDKGHHILRVITTVISDFMTIEDHFTHSLQKLLKTLDHGTGLTDLFGSSPNISLILEEGESMAVGWKSTKTQLQRAIEIHQEFRSLLSEPVSLSLTMMKQEYEAARNATQENFVKAHTTLCHDAATHWRLHQKLETKSKEFAQVFASLPDAPIANTNESTVLDTEVAMSTLQVLASSPSFTERDRKNEAKLRYLSEEMRELQQRVAESSVALKQKYNAYIQDVEVFISVYMKNEKYRLQVEKSSLVSFIKAFEHLLNGCLLVATQTLRAMEQINSTSDVSDFIKAHRKPWQRSKRIVPVLHNNAMLTEALREYYRTRVSSPIASASSEEKSSKTKSTAPPDDGFSLATKGSSSSTTHEDFSVASTPSDNAIETAKPVAVENHSAVAGQDAAGEKEPVTAPASEEAQPLGVSDFQKKFKLDSPEQVVESYSCALYVNNFPCHGRLYLTKDHICFNGWRDTIYVASYMDITVLEKKNTALIVPNAIEITSNGEKAFFASFVFRDECFNCIQQLQAIKKGTMEIMAGRNKKRVPPIDTSRPERTVTKTSEPPAENRPPVPVPAPVAPAPVAQLVPETSPVVVSKPPEKDALLDEYELVLEEQVGFSVEFAHSVLWVASDAFTMRLMESSGETNIQITKWDTAAPVTYTAVTKPDSFDGTRRVAYTHNKKYMVGPSAIPTSQVQRFKWEPGSRLVVSVTSSVSDVPYCDYFRVESRWVFSAATNPMTCLLQVGARVQWVKSTWLKKQIEGTTISEAKEATKVWLQAALAAAKTQTAAPASVATTEIKAAVVPDTIEKQPTATGKIESVAMVSDGAHVVSTAVAGRSAAPVDSSTTLLRWANVVCILLFIYTMHRVSKTMEAMQVVTQDLMAQNREQQALLRDLLTKLQQLR